MGKLLSSKRPKYEKPNKSFEEEDDVSINREQPSLPTAAAAPSPLPANVSNLERELYFLFSRFLQTSGHFGEQTAGAFITEAVGKQLLPVHATWTGDLRSMNYEDACRAYSHLPPDYLIQILRRGIDVINDVYPLDGGCSTSLLTDGRRSLLRNEQNCLNISGKRRLRLVAPGYDAKPRAAVLKEPLNFLLSELQQESRTAPLSLHSRYSARKFAGDFRLLKTIYSHLAPVFCTSYDATGRYFFTASDDRLIKIHETRSGRLLTTLRGHPKELGDMSIDNENRLLVSGCTGNTIRVWRLLDGKPVAAFRAHTHTVSSVKFLPLTFDKRRRFFASAGLDGNLVLWEYDQVDLKFDAVEPRYLVDYRGRNSGTTQFGVVCFSFSKGGLFLACGSNDHYLRVFRLLTLKKTGSSRSRQHACKLDLCVEEDYCKKAHTDRVDSIVFANNSTRFVSGSRDGKGLIWRRDAEGWQSIEINCSTSWCDPSSDPQADRKARIAMVAWSCDDRLVFTSSSKNSIHCVKVWNSYSGAILHDLFGHYADIFVLAAHPWQTDILLTASHDGQAVLWNPSTGEKLWSWQNIIANCGQEDFALLDAAFNPEGDQAVITDYHGNVHIFGITSGSTYQNVPQHQFFHTDYHPTDNIGERVVDRNTQLDAYLMQPPLLVHADGDPYNWHFQRLVPGRETITYEQTRSIRTQIQQQYIHNALAMQLGDAGAAVAVPAVQLPGVNIAGNDAQVAVAIMGFANAMGPQHEPVTAAVINSVVPAVLSAAGPSSGGAVSLTAATSSRAIDPEAVQPAPSQKFDVTKAFEGERRIVEPYDAETEHRVLDEKQVVTQRELEEYLLLKDRLHRHKRLAKLAAAGIAGIATVAVPAVPGAAETAHAATASGGLLPAPSSSVQQTARAKKRSGQVMRLRSHQPQRSGGGLRDGRNRARPPRDQTVPDAPQSLHLLRQLMRRPPARQDANRSVQNAQQPMPTPRSGSARRRQRNADAGTRREAGNNSIQSVQPPSRQQQLLDAHDHDSDADPDWEVHSDDVAVENLRVRRRRGSVSSHEYIESRGVRPLRPAHPDRSFDTSSSEEENAVLSETDEDVQEVSGSENDDGMYLDDDGGAMEEHQLERFGSRRRKRALEEARARRINNQNMPAQNPADLRTPGPSGRPVRANRGRSRVYSSGDEEAAGDDDEEDDDESRRRSTRLRDRSQRGQRLRWFEDENYSGGEEFQHQNGRRSRTAHAADAAASRSRRRARVVEEEAEEMEVDGDGEVAGQSTSTRTRRPAGASMPNSNRVLTGRDRRTAAALRRLADSETSVDNSPLVQENESHSMQKNDADPSSSASLLRNWLALPTAVGRHAEVDCYDATHPNAWIRQHTARRSPYFPQINDLVCYYKKAHAKFVDFVNENNVMELSERQRDLANRLADVDFLRVTDISFVFMDSSWPQLEGSNMRQLVVAKIKLCRVSVESVAPPEAAPAAVDQAESNSSAAVQSKQLINDKFKQALFCVDEGHEVNVGENDRILNAVASKLAADAVLGALSDLRHEMSGGVTASSPSIAMTPELPSQSLVVNITDNCISNDVAVADESDSDVYENEAATPPSVGVCNIIVTDATSASKKPAVKRKARGGRRLVTGRKRAKRAKTTATTPPQPGESSSTAAPKAEKVSTPNGIAVGDEIEIMYADLLNVDPFLVLLSDVRDTCQIKWQPKDLCSAVLDGRRWYGQVVAVKPYENWQYSAGAYGALSVQWKQPANPSELIELFSPWDLMPVPPGTKLATVKDGCLLSRDDCIDLGERYDAAPEIRAQWPASDRVKTLWFINQYVNHIQNNELFRVFVRAVDVKKYSSYLSVVPYPLELKKICTRANYMFYRTLDAVRYDAECISRNCKLFNRPGMVICKQADVLTELLTRMLDAVRQLKEIPELPDFEWIDRLTEQVIEDSGGSEYLDVDDVFGEEVVAAVKPAARVVAASSSRRSTHPNRRALLDDFIAADDADDDDAMDDDEQSHVRYPKRQTRGKLPMKYQAEFDDDGAADADEVGNSTASRRKSNRVAEQLQTQLTITGRRGGTRANNLFNHCLPLQRGDFQPNAARSSRTSNIDRTPNKQRPNVRHFVDTQNQPSSSLQAGYADDAFDGPSRRSVRIVARNLAAVDAEQPQIFEESRTRNHSTRTTSRPLASYAQYDEAAGISSNTTTMGRRRQSFRSSPRRGSNIVRYAESGTSDDDYTVLANMSGTDIEQASDDANEEASEETFSTSTNDASGNSSKGQIKLRLTRQQTAHNTRGAKSAYVLAEVKEEDENEAAPESNAMLEQVDEDYAETDGLNSNGDALNADQHQLLSTAYSTLFDDSPPYASSDVKMELQQAGALAGSSSSSAGLQLANVDAYVEMTNGVHDTMPNIVDDQHFDDMDVPAEPPVLHEPLTALQNGHASASHAAIVNGVSAKTVRSGGRRRVKMEDDGENETSNLSTPSAAVASSSAAVTNGSLRKSSRAPVRKVRSDFIYGEVKKHRVKDDDFKLEDGEDAPSDGLETDHDDDVTDQEDESKNSDEDISPASSSRGGSSYGRRRKKPPTRKSITKKRSASKSKKAKTSQKRQPAGKKKTNVRTAGNKRKPARRKNDDDDNEDGDTDEDYDEVVAKPSSSHSQRRPTRTVARRNASYNIDEDFGSGDEF